MIYFDNSATTKISDSALDVFCKYSKNDFANASAMHRFGFDVDKDINKCKEDIAKIIGAEKAEIIFTSGGTESNNLAILGYIDAYKRTGNHIITTKIEHSSVYDTIKKLEKEGFLVSYLSTDKNGKINIEELKSLLKKETLLVSIMYVNNEIGTVQDIENIGRLIKSLNPKTAFHVDFVQGFAKYKINVKKAFIDFLSVSAHKFHGPKGVGFLYKNKDFRINKQIIGGKQQNDLRAGTINSPGIMAMAIAAKDAYDNLASNFNKLITLRDCTIKLLLDIKKTHNNIIINTKETTDFAPHIVSFGVKGVRAEVLLHSLEEYEIYVSAGSACSTHDKHISRTLKAIGLNDKEAESIVRLSFSIYNSKEEIDYFIDKLNIILKKIIIV